jgi:major membrane immunogen (membrane-anchored lipoprotein)
MRYITTIEFEEQEYGKFLSVKMDDGKAIIHVTDHALYDGEYNLQIQSEGSWSLPIEGKKPLLF